MWYNPTIHCKACWATSDTMARPMVYQAAMLCCQADPEQLRSPKRFIWPPNTGGAVPLAMRFLAGSPFSSKQLYHEVFSNSFFSPHTTTWRGFQQGAVFPSPDNMSPMGVVTQQGVFFHTHTQRLLPNKGFSYKSNTRWNRHHTQTLQTLQHYAYTPTWHTCQHGYPKWVPRQQVLRATQQLLDPQHPTNREGEGQTWLRWGHHLEGMGVYGGIGPPGISVLVYIGS